jgi:hypothetical protein
VKELKRKILLTVLALALVLLATPYIGNAYAKPPEAVAGEIVLTSVVLSEPPRPAGESDNTILRLDILEEWSGDIEGTATTEASWIVHNSPYTNPDAWVNVHAIITFSDVTVLDRSGTLTIKIDVEGTEAHWTIMGGTGELANVRGQGKGSIATEPFTYTGLVHFDP